MTTSLSMHDVRSEDYEYNPAIEPNKATAWLNLLAESEDAFERWHEHCDNIDKLYASLERLSSGITGKGCARQRIPNVLGEYGGRQTFNLRQGADPCRRAEIQR